MYRRNLSPTLLDALADSPVVLLNGARQTGKTTLVQTLAAEKHPAQYLTLDDAGILSAAKADPAGFVAGLNGPVIIDEVQRAPELLSAIKVAVDRNRASGRFLLTGSANVLTLPRLSESLAGRMEILTLWPLAQSEIEGAAGSFTDLIFSEDPLSIARPEPSRTPLLARLLAGGYPEPLGRRNQARRSAWFGSYLTTILQRDIRDLAQIEGLTDIPRLLSLLAARAASLLNLADVSRDSRLPYSTLTRYLSLLEATFLVRLLPAWASNRGQRFVKSPKLLISDSGLIGHLLGLGAESGLKEERLLGPMLENFVALELLKDASWSASRPELFHFRTHDRKEVDLVLEDPSGRLVGIEVKASATVTAGDLKGLFALREIAGERFVRGLVAYTGEQVIPFGERLHAVPVNTLWEALRID
jgi:predicted AAA+ superfamily ATPase